MNSNELLEALEESRLRLLQALEPLEDEAFYREGVMDNWTLADILAHLAAWESELVTALQQIKAGKRPTSLLSAYEDIDGYNRLRVQESKGREIDRILADSQGLRRQLEKVLAEFSDQELNDPKRYEWSRGHPLWRHIEDNSFGHELQHIDDIERFSEEWSAEQ